MSENEETSSSERVKGDEYVLKKANEANLKEVEEKGTRVKIDVKEDANSEKENDILYIDIKKHIIVYKDTNTSHQKIIKI